jgi:hypothetical protein
VAVVLSYGHVYLDNTWYFITGATTTKRRYLNPAGHKEVVRDQVKTLVEEFGIRLAA